MPYRTILYEKRGPGAWITLNRPEERNAISPELIRDLSEALDQAGADPEVRAVVLTGAGPAFCAGADLKSTIRSQNALDETDTESLMDYLRQFERVLRTIRTLPKPVIAAINGVTCAGGIETIVCCDMIVAAESATFSDAHARHGFLPGLGGGLGLARAVGPFKAKEMLFTADFFTARDMAAAGLVNHVLPDDELAGFVDELVRKMAERSPVGLARMKQLINDGLDVPWDVAVRYEMLTLEAQTRTQDFQEGLKAFNEKRRPRFTGK
ncbi:MAG: enoyl-CoA hydratase/isomerase family protein [Proteobacteria bacterium]|nr:enoyl-CoA hydratase/isomerase family protein [Pseudomonadota bacterium]